MARVGPLDIGIMGGVGQRIDLEDPVAVAVRTPYGSTSEPVQVGTLGGRRVAFISRRGTGEVIQPHLVPYRANIWALASLGAGAVITTAAAGGLRSTFPPGMFVVTDQLIDHTHGRPSTFYDEGPAIMLSDPEPFDPTLRGLAMEALAAQRVRYRDFGTAVVINGPRFNTRAESRYFAATGGDLVTATLMPEVCLALELGMAVANVSFITDSDSGTASDLGDTVSTDLVQRRIAQARPVINRALTELVRAVPAGFRPTTGVPADAIASVLAREPV